MPKTIKKEYIHDLIRSWQWNRGECEFWDAFIGRPGRWGLWLTVSKQGNKWIGRIGETNQPSTKLYSNVERAKAATVKLAQAEWQLLIDAGHILLVNDV